MAPSDRPWFVVGAKLDSTTATEMEAKEALVGATAVDMAFPIVNVRRQHHAVFPSRPIVTMPRVLLCAVPSREPGHAQQAHRHTVFEADVPIVGVH